MPSELTLEERTIADDVVAAVALTLTIDPEDIMTRWRKAEVVRARDFCIYILRTNFHWKLRLIQEYFKIQSHSSVMYCVTRGANQLKKNKKLSLQYNHIKVLLANPAKLFHLAQQLSNTNTYDYKSIQERERRRQSQRYFQKKCARIGTPILNNIINDIKLGFDNDYISEVYSQHRLTPHFISLLRTELDRHGSITHLQKIVSTE